MKKNLEKCNKCCFDLKNKEEIKDCKERCQQGEHCEKVLMTCYTQKYLGE